MNSKVYKWCAVPQCKNTSITTPDKVFVYVPNKKLIREKWSKLARRNPNDVVTNSTLYFCEDHFDLPNDMDNYMEYHVMGSVSQVRMKPGCMPKKFICQRDRKTRTPDTTELSYIAKKQRTMILEECEKQIEEKRIVIEPSSPEEIASGSSDIPATMDDDIDIEEHDVMDHPRIKSIFPDLSRVKIEILDGEDIVEGTKPPVAPDALYQETLNSHPIVYLENWKDRLQSSPFFCNTCAILFPTVNALDTHKMVSHSYLVAMDIPQRNTARKYTAPSKYCNHCSKTFPDDTSLIKYLNEFLPLNNFSVKEEIPEPEIAQNGPKFTSTFIQWPEKIKSTSHVISKIHPKKIKLEPEDTKNESENFEEAKSKLEERLQRDGIFFTASSLVPKTIPATMDDDIDIEEHDVMDHPKIKSIFPDLSRVKIEILVGEDIVEGTKPPVAPDALYEEALNSRPIVYLENWEDRLQSSPCFCNTCAILFPTVNALDTHKMVSHSNLVAMDTPQRNTARKSTAPSKYCNHCSKTFPDDTSLIKHLNEFLPSKNLSVKKKIPEPKIAQNEPKFTSKPIQWPKKIKSTSHVIAKETKNESENFEEVKSKLEERLQREGKFLAASSLVPKSTLFQCNICQIGFLSCFSALQHSKYCEKLLPFNKCGICKRKIRTKDSKVHELQHNYNDTLKMYTINKNIYERVLCKCPKCSVCFDELGFWAHYQKCENSENNSIYCSDCDVSIASSCYQNHRLKHFTKKLTKKDFIVVEFYDQNNLKLIIF